MNLEEAKTLIKTFLTKSNRLNHNLSELYNSYIEDFRVLMNAESHITVLTLMHCILYDKPIYTCDKCGKQTNIYNFVSYKPAKFCSVECMNTFDYRNRTNDEVYTDYLNLFDKNGHLALARVEKFVGKNTIKDLQNKTGLITTDLRTLLYEILKDTVNIKYCQECNTPIAFKLSKEPWPTDRLHFCSNECRNKNKAYRENIGAQKLNIKRSASAVYREKVGRPWFDAKMQYVLDTENVTVHCTYEQFIETELNHTLHNCTCNKCGSKFKSKIARIPWCKKCNKYSRRQKAIVDFVDSYGYTTLVNDRNLILPYEVDILLEKEMIGIEFDGLYYHRNKNDYHKYLMCLDLGYRLIKIYDDENKEIVKSRLTYVLNKTKNKIHGRKCNIIEVNDNVIHNKFMKENNIQGILESEFKYGLEFDNELVAMMAFNSTEDGFELVQFCTKINTIVNGGVSKLYKYFLLKHNPTKVISYCDLRWNTGSMYETLGFKLLHKTKFNYYYWKNRIRIPQYECSKAKVLEMYPESDKSLTVDEIMEINGYFKIYDFGDLVFVHERQQNLHISETVV